MNTKPTSANIEAQIKATEEALSKEREQGNSVQLLYLLRKLGQLHLDNGDAPQALTQYDEALKLVAQTSDKESHAQILGFRGLALKLIGNFSLALQSFRRSNAIAGEISHTALMIDSYIQIALLLSEKGDVTEAISNLSRAMASAQEKNDPARKMRISSLLADNFLRIEAFDKAVDYYVLGTELARELKNQAAETSFLIKIANIFLMEKEIESAIGQYERALKIASAIEDRNSEINILGGLFRAYAVAGNQKLASVYGEQVIHLARQIDHVEAEFSNILSYASFLAENGRFADGKSQLERGLQIAIEQKNPDLESEIFTRMGLLASQQNNNAEALDDFAKALEIARSVSNLPLQANLLAYIASIHAEDGHIQESIDASKEALSLAQELENPRLMAEQQVLLAFNHRDIEQNEKAIQYCSAAIESYQALSDEAMMDRANTLLSELQALEK